MAKSLQEQLRKSGLVSAQDARKAQAEKRKKSRKARSGHGDEDAARRAELARAAAEKAEHDRRLNAERKAAADARALVAQIDQIVDMNRIDPGKHAGVTYHFTEDGKVRSQHVTPPLHKALGEGRVAIVRDSQGRHALVPAGAAEKIRSRGAAHVLVLNERSAETQAQADDDPYAQFEVPDDLMW